MLLHNLKQIVRGMWKYKGFSLINLLGLSIGTASVMLIFLIADYEKRFDKQHSGEENIYRVTNRIKSSNRDRNEAVVPYPMAKLLRTDNVGIRATQVHFSQNANIRIGNQSPFQEKNILFADSLFFDVFDFSAVSKFQIIGDAVKALSEPNKVVLTAATAQRYFGDKNPVGQLIKMDAKISLEVAAVIKDIQPTTHLPFNMIASYSSLTGDFIGGFDLDSWGIRSGGYCYVKLNDKFSAPAVERSLSSISKKMETPGSESKEKFSLQSLAQIHFDPTFETTNPSYTVSSRYLLMLVLLAVFIVLIACINYINLSTSLAFSKAKEVGIRKTIGASKRQLFFFYMSETLLLTSIAAILGLALAFIGLPVINRLLDKSISITQLLDLNFILGALLSLVLISFISGIYPALILAGFKPIISLKNQLTLPGRSSAIFRRSLIVFQFTTSIALIICTIVIAKQVNYFNTKSLGFNKDAVVEISLPVTDSAKRMAFQNSLVNQPGIKQISFCLGAPISDNGINTSLKAENLSGKEDHDVKVIACDKNYLETYGINLVAGRWFFQGEEKNLGSGIVVNETLVNTLGYKNVSDAIGKKITIGINEYDPQIIGVVKNFHTSSLHQNIMPVAMMPFPYFYYAVGVRIQPGTTNHTLSIIETAFKKVYPENVYQFSFIDEQLAKLYAQDARDYNLFKAFSGISIFICCIGLWGLIAFVIVRKTKEIGIRKVLGASIYNIVGLLSKDFLKLIILALIIASPIAWYFMHQWLQDFAYRVNISWWIFGAAGLFAVVIAIITISFQALKAALSNPVKNLRTE